MSDLCTRCNQKEGTHVVSDMGVFCDDCVDYAQQIADEEDAVEDPDCPCDDCEEIRRIREA